MAVPMRSAPATRIGATPLELAPASVSMKFAASTRPWAASPPAIGAVVPSRGSTRSLRGTVGNADIPNPRIPAPPGDPNDVPHSAAYWEPGAVVATHPGPARSFHV